MGKRLRKLVSILLVLVMIIGMCPNSVVMAEESSDSGVTATVTDAEEDVTEEKNTEERDTEEDITEISNTEESDSSKVTEENDISTETDAQTDEESYPAFSPDPVTIDGVRISVSASEGVFPEGASLSVLKVSNAELGAVEEAIDEERDENEKVALTYTYDIKVLDKDGNELQPKDGAEVKVSFSADAVANENLDTNVYHVSEDEAGGLSADVLLTEESGTTVSASTDGFSYYTVEFTYDEKQYVMQGDSNVALVDILSFVGITKADGNAAESSDISAVSISNEELFSASNESGEWIVTANQAFTSTEWMKVTVDGVEYEIVVTDATTNTVSVTVTVHSVTCDSSIQTFVGGEKTVPKYITISTNKGGTSGWHGTVYSNNVNGTYTFEYEGEEPTAVNFTVTYQLPSTTSSSSLNCNDFSGSGEFGSTKTASIVHTIAAMPWPVSSPEQKFYETITYSASYTVTPNSVDPTYTSPTAKTLIYNASSQQLVNAATTNGGTLKYALGNNATTAPTTGWSTTVPSGTNAGTYYVWYQIEAATGYNAVAPKCVTASIGQANNPITYANQSWSYNFATIAQTKNLNQATNAQGTITYSLQSQTGGSYFGFNTSTRVLTAAANTPVGTYTVVIRASTDGNTNYKSGTKDSTVTVTIGKTSSSATAPIAANKTYNGSAQTIAAGGSASGGTIYYGLGSSTTSGPSSSSWSTTLPSATNAGDYYIWYKVTGDSNHNDVAATYAAKATISKRTVTPTAPTLTTGTLTYDGTDKTLANAGSTTAGGTMYYYVSTSSTTPTFSISTWEQSIDTKTDAGTYYIFWYDYVSDIANNNDTTTDKINSVQSLGSRTIGNATITVNAPNQSYTYTSNPQGTAITATSVNLQAVTIKYGTESGSYNLTTAPTAINVADSKIIYYQVTAPNHNTVTGSYTLTIIKAEASVTAPTANALTYNGTVQELVTAGSTSDGTLQYKLGTSGTYSTDIPTATNAGTYYVWYRVKGDSNHNDTEPLCIPVTIENASMSVSSEGYTGIYDAQAHGITVTAPEGATVNYRTTDSGAYDLTDNPTYTDAGTYTVYYQITKPNYTTVTGSETVVINKKQLELSWDDSTRAFTYDGSSHKPSASITGVLGDDDCGVAVSGEQTDYSVSAYTATASLTGEQKDNYVLPTEHTTIFTIAKREVTVTAKSQTVKLKDDISRTVNDAELSGAVEGHTLSEIAFEAVDTTSTTTVGNERDIIPQLL